MQRCLVVLALVLAPFLSACGGCGGDDTNNPIDAATDGPPTDGGQLTEVTCEQLPAVTSGTCQVQAGGAAKLLRGEVLTPTKLFHGGGVAIDATGSITCVGCDCAEAGQTVVTCPDASISPGLINTHDHITFTQNPPYTDNGVRYDHRHQWRKGQDGKAMISSRGNASDDQIRWGELRFLMGGATSIVGSGGQPGLLRNLDSAQQEGLNQKPVDFDTFPLGDGNSGTRRTSDCNYGSGAMTAAQLANLDSYEPHTSEGVDQSARNEFLCQSSTSYDTMAPGVSNNLTIAKTAMIHAVGLQPADYGAMAAAGTALIWSPRSNITLYGETARVSTAARLGVEIALGTDWMPTGSMNMLRELACADSFNKTYLDGYFTDVQLWQMVTSNAAAVTATDDVIGLLAPGRVADIAIFKRNGKDPYRAVIEAEAKDVVLVMRGGKTLYGDETAVSGLSTATCDVVDVCGSSKKLCLSDEVGKGYNALKTAAGANIYPAFVCGAPPNEPTCTPKRPTANMGSTVFTGIPSATDADGDGIADGADNCPNVFNPVRPVDMGTQGDSDSDGLGDTCDPCPLDANSTACGSIDPNDRDHDGEPNDTDNCPDIANGDQADNDDDGKGNVCDPCPEQANPGSAGCAVTIYAIKDGTVPVGASVQVTNALVTGKGTNGFFVQIKETDGGYNGPDYSGLFVYTGTAAPTLAAATVGARVTIDGKVAVYQGQTELDSVSSVTQTAAGPEAPPMPITVSYADVITGGPRALTLESVIVSLGASSVTALDAMYGEATLTDANNNKLVMDDFLYVPSPALTVGQTYSSVRGILTLRQMASKLEPRSAADLTSGAPGLTSFGPALTFTRIGTSNVPTFPTPLRVTLSGPASTDTVVMVMSTNTNALTVQNVTIPAGASFADVPVSAVAVNADVTVIASLGASMLMAHVRVLGTTEEPASVSISPSTAAVSPGGSATFIVTLDIPALSATQVALSVNPSNAGTLPATVSIAAGQTSATFTYTDTSAIGTATITASFGASPATAVVTVSTGANHLVINEVDYDQTSTDTTEFIEIYNPSSSPISLANKQIILINGADEVRYATINLGTGMLAAGGYLVIAGANVTVQSPATKLDPGWDENEIQNGEPDGIALVDNATHTLIDALSYEGAMPMLALPGFTGEVSLVEGTMLSTSVADPGSGAGSLCRSPNGQDTDNAATDWKLCTAPSAGTANP
ncbi:MAG: lamin tail domain-containing protein [Kofleriaceae bacterium]|nr:lamin tail domain-containing protein [Kofleriaceae bacterium]